MLGVGDLVARFASVERQVELIEDVFRCEVLRHHAQHVLVGDTVRERNALRVVPARNVEHRTTAQVRDRRETEAEVKLNEMNAI